MWNSFNSIFNLPQSPRRDRSSSGRSAAGARGEKRTSGGDIGWEAGGSSPSRQRRGPTPTMSPATSPTRQRVATSSSSLSLSGDATSQLADASSPTWRERETLTSNPHSPLAGPVSGGASEMDVDFVDGTTVTLHDSPSRRSQSEKAHTSATPRTPPTIADGGRERRASTGTCRGHSPPPSIHADLMNLSPNSNSSIKQAATSNNALRRERGASMGTDRYIPNRASLNFDLGGQELSKAIHDENVHESAIENGGNPDPTIAASASNIIANGNKHSRNRVHLSVLTKSSDMHSQGKRLMDVFEHRGKQVGSVPYDDGFSRLREDLPNYATASTSTSPGAWMGGAGPRKTPSRHIPDKPCRILDAPDLMDDYYLNLLHWGQTNVIAVALNQSVYLWHADTGRIDNLMTLSTTDDYITSVQWSDNSTLAVGTSSSVVQLWDATTLQKTRDLAGHTSRVSSLSWNTAQGSHMLSSGSRDSSILHHDTRAQQNVTQTLLGHTQEVCGLAWSPDGSTLASGGNENRLCIWDLQSSTQRQRSNSVSAMTANAANAPRYTIEEHNAAVKAVAWCPWQRNVLASGGGTADRTIRVWNTTTGTCLKSVDTGSQVCAIQWSINAGVKELVSSHGFSDNQLILWKYSNAKLTKVQEFHGHTSRVLHLARSPDGSTICSASADETIRFWDMFGSAGGGAGASRGTSSGGKAAGVSRGGLSPAKPALLGSGSGSGPGHGSAVRSPSFGIR